MRNGRPALPDLRCGQIIKRDGPKRALKERWPYGAPKNIFGECVSCAPGKYKAGTGDVACTDCEAGKFSITSEATAESTCFECPAGKYQGNDAASACTDCDPGKFSAAEGQSSVGTCIPCYASTDSSTVEGGGAAHTGCVCKAGYHQNAAPIAAGSTMTCTVSSSSLSPTHCSCAVAHTASVLASPCLESSVYDRDRVCADAPRASELVYMHKHLLHTSPGLRRWHVSSHQRRHRGV